VFESQNDILQMLANYDINNENGLFKFIKVVACKVNVYHFDVNTCVDGLYSKYYNAVTFG